MVKTVRIGKCTTAARAGIRAVCQSFACNTSGTGSMCRANSTAAREKKTNRSNESG